MLKIDKKPTIKYKETDLNENTFLNEIKIFLKDRHTKKNPLFCQHKTNPKKPSSLMYQFILAM